MHEREAAAAVRAIAKHGRAVQLVVIQATETPGPAWDPAATELSTEEVLTPLTALQTTFSAMEKAGDLIKTGDVALLFDGQRAIPTDARIRDGGTDYSIVDAQPVQPGERVLLWRVIARR